MSDIIKGTIAANGYVPIQDESGKKICEFSTLNKNDPMADLLAPNLNMNLPIDSSKKQIRSNSAKQAPVCTDDEIYQLQTVILKKLNAFNAEYSNYIIYKFNNSHQLPGDQTKKLNYTDDNGNVVTYTPTAQQKYDTKYTKTQSASDLSTYKDLMTNLQTYDSVLQVNQMYRMDPTNPMLKNLSNYYTPGTQNATPQMKNNHDTELSNRDPLNYLVPKHQQITKLRSDLDNKLLELNNNSISVFGESKIQMDASIYVTILWTTLATAVVYYTFVHM